MATPNVSADLAEEAQSLTLDSINPAIRESKEWRILVYGVNSSNYTQEQNDHHMSLLSGILGEDVTVDKHILSSFSCEKNGVTVTVHIGSHDECTVSHEDVDLLLLFIPLDADDVNLLNDSYSTDIRDITDKRGALIWKHSIAILTGINRFVECQSGDISTRLDTQLKTWTSLIHTILLSCIGNEDNVTKTDVLIRPTGVRSQPNLPKPHELWFTQLWLGCFASSKIGSMPAIIKLAQERISNSISISSIKELELYQQPIQAKEGSIALPARVKLGLGIGGSAAIVGAGAVGATVGALIGALAIGIPSFGVAAGTGLALGAVVGGGLGASIAGAAVGGKYQAEKNKQFVEISVSELKLYYSELLTRLPKMCSYLNSWAQSQVSCRIVVAGIKGEGVSTVAAAITDREPNKDLKGFYWGQIIPSKANLVVYDYPGFPNIANKQEKAKELISFQKKKDTNLLIYCIKMTSAKEDLVFSPHVKYLERFCEIDNNILSHTVIALTHANELRSETKSPQANFQQYFKDELVEWKKQVKIVLTKYIHIEDDIADKIPVVPVGNNVHSIDLSDNGRPTPATQYHWLSELLLQSMPVTKPEGVPTLIKTNKKRMETQSTSNHYPNLHETSELLTEAQCLMFSQVGQTYKKHSGSAIGLILGVKDQQCW